MPRQIVIDVQQGFSGGLNLTADESQVQPNELRRAENARLTVFGSVKKRLGTQRLHAAEIGSGEIVRGGFGWVQTDGTVQQLAVSNGVLHTATYGIPTTWTAQAGSLDPLVQPSFAAFFDGSADIVYVADGGLLNSWDGTTHTNNIAGTPAVSQIATYNLRLWGAGDTTNPARLYWSDLGDGDTLGNVALSGTGYADIRTFGQQQITALCPLGGALLVFHPNAISVFEGYSQDDFNVNAGTRGLSGDVGTRAPRAVVVVENTVYFLSERGPYRATLQGVEPIGAKIESVFADLDQSLFDRACAAHSRATREVLFYLPDVGVFAFNYRLNSWTGPWNEGYVDQTVHSLWDTVNETSVPIVLYGGNDGFVRRVDAPDAYKDDILSDDTGGTTFSLVARCHRFFFGDAFAEKALRWFYINGDLGVSTGAGLTWQTSLTAGSVSIPNVTTSIWGAGNWGTFIWGGLGSLQQRTQAWGSGTFADIVITDDGLAESEFSAIQAHAFNLTRRFS